jgi:hypothetical protein
MSAGEARETLERQRRRMELFRPPDDERTGYGRPDCDVCHGTGHIIEREGEEPRPFDPDLENHPDVGEVWVCPNCFWADGDPAERWHGRV